MDENKKFENPSTAEDKIIMDQNQEFENPSTTEEKIVMDQNQEFENPSTAEEKIIMDQNQEFENPSTAEDKIIMDQNQEFENPSAAEDKSVMDQNKKFENSFAVEEKIVMDQNKKFENPSSVPPVQQKKPSRRRVGTFTMGCCLIVVGIVVLAAMFTPTIDLVTIAKFSPVIFILLGIEILVAYFRSHGEKIKYDFLSGFVCFLLIIGAIGCVAVPFVWNHFGPERYQVQATLQADLQQECYNLLQDQSEVQDVHPYLNLYELHDSFPTSVEELSPSDYLNIEIVMDGDFQDPYAFAESCRKALDRLSALKCKYATYSFHYKNDRQSMWLHVDDPFTANASAEKLAALTEVIYIEEDPDIEDTYIEEFE